MTTEHHHAHVHPYHHREARSSHTPKLKHSYLVPRPYDSRSSLRFQSLEELLPRVQENFRRVIARHENAHAEPFLGVTTDGQVEKGLYSLTPTGLTLDPVITAAQLFLDELSNEERSVACFPIDAPQWRHWSNAHAFHFRHGVCMEFLNKRQRGAALNLLRETLSSAGYASSRDVMKLY